MSIRNAGTGCFQSRSSRRTAGLLGCRLLFDLLVVGIVESHLARSNPAFQPLTLGFARNGHLSSSSD